MFKILNKNKGFSLAEVLVVLAIIGILAGVVLINYPAAKKHLALQRATTKLAQDIRRAQEMAISSQECCGSPPLVPETGYGIYINEDNKEYYLLYADTGGDQKSFDNADDIIQTIYLEKEIKIYDIPYSAPNKVSINFSPPDPEITIKWQIVGSPENKATIILCIDKTNCTGSDIKTVYVNRAGLITVY